MPSALRGITKFQHGEELLTEHMLFPRYHSCHFKKRKRKKKVCILINMHTFILVSSPCRFHIPLFFLHLKTIIFNRSFCNQKSLCSYQYRQEIQRHIFRSAEMGTTGWALFYPLAILLQLSVFLLLYGGFPE